MRTSVTQQTGAFPAGRVGYAVGDIHGRADLLKNVCVLLTREAAAFHEGAERPILVFLGDYVDRGPGTREVIDLLVHGFGGFETYFLRGNHEQAMLEAIVSPSEMRPWLQHGGTETLVSYGVRPPPLGAASSQLAAVGKALAEALPPEHRNFLDGLAPYAEIGGYLFVHAGVDPDKTLEEQTDGDLLWIRDRFLSDESALSHVIVHGHTPTEEPVRTYRRIGLDTGAYATGRLSVARFEGRNVAVVSVTVAAPQANPFGV
jgi:serine/threonine protein phosphatase 1